MSAYPQRGVSPWDDPLKVYIDSKVADSTAGSATDAGVSYQIANGPLTGAAIDTKVDDLVDAALASHTPGAEIAYAERITPGSTVATAIGTAANITGLLVNVVGTGRPVEIELYLSGVYHTTAGSLISMYIANNGSVLTAGPTGYGIQGYAKSDINNAGRAGVLTRRMVLTAGVAYSFQAGFYSTVGASSVFAGAGYSVNYLSVRAL